MKKLLSILLCIATLTSALSLISNAFEIPVGTGYLEGQESISFPEYNFTESDTVSANRFYSNGSNSHLFYNQLTAAQKVVYNAIVASQAGLNDGGYVTVDFGDTL